MTDRTTPAADGAAALPAPAAATRSRVTTDAALVAAFAAFIAVCAILPGIPTPSGVPITLQTFAVILAGLVLGWRRGGLAVLLYLVVGLAGLPVFSGGRSGLAVLAGPTGGYLVAFPLAAVLAGLFAARATRVRPPARWSREAPVDGAPTGGRGTIVRSAAAALPVAAVAGAGLAASLLSIHPLGIAGLVLRAGMSVPAAVAADAVFLPGDVVKNVVAAVVAAAVFRAFPELLRSRR